MSTTVELISATDTITLEASPSPETPWVYNNATLDAWYALAPVDTKISKRPNAHGAYGLGRIFAREHNPIVNGQYYGETTGEALAARNRLNAMFSNGGSITMRVTDDLGPTTREVWLVESATEFRYDFTHFPFDIVLVAPDPRRYGPTYSESEGMPSAGTGLFWDLGTAPSGLFFDWGTPGRDGRVSFTNGGSATTFPRIEVGGAGAFAAGFRVTEIETGAELTFERPTNDGDVVVLDSRTKRATLGSGDVSAFLSSRDWFSVPAGATRRYQITALGGFTGSPTISIYAKPATL